ncbi:CD63 antigen-like [Limulus polyphemus]|uniref:Tetraspanin n=1 Tax=Limulus polyphemus TaxID=6850 RepID=A0ABM1BI34_LIMPO|nr:CD63 antigen-like [Limulus polyphemus]
MVQGGMSVVKYLLFAFNFIFVVTGAALIAVGAWVQAKAAEYVDFLGDKYTSAPILLIVVGVIIFILSFMGCCGAIKENYCMVMTFAVLLFIIFVLELVAGILAYVYKSEVETVLRKNMKNAMMNYNESNHDIVTKTWDDMQSNLKCCGANNASEWKKYMGEVNLPYSCCPGKDPTKPCQITDDHFTKGCVDALASFLEDKILVVGGVGIGIAFVQIIGIIFSCCLARAIKKEYEVV